MTLQGVAHPAEWGMHGKPGQTGSSRWPAGGDCPAGTATAKFSSDAQASQERSLAKRLRCLCTAHGKTQYDTADKAPEDMQGTPVETVRKLCSPSSKVLEGGFGQFVHLPSDWLNGKQETIDADR